MTVVLGLHDHAGEQHELALSIDAVRTGDRLDSLGWEQGPIVLSL